MSENYEKFARYTQQIKLEEIGIDGQEQLQKARVLCIGAGGIGVTLLSYLAGAGIGTLGIIDDDFIEKSNLHRQILYHEHHVGKAKAIIAKKYVDALNSSIQVHAYHSRLTLENAEQMIEHYDIVADCTDNFYTRYLIHDTCYRLGKPYVYASAYQFQGHCSLFYGRHNPCLHCLFPIIPDIVANCHNGGVLGTLPGLLGIVQATEIIKWITRSGASLLNQLLCIDFLTMEMKKIQLVKNMDCSFCIHGKMMEQSFISSCDASFDSDSFAISPQKLLSFLRTNLDIVLLDVRTVAEHRLKNIGGKNIPLSELSMRLNELDPLAPILIYCQSGQRSHYAFKILRQAGFCFVYHLTNGIEGLVNFRIISSLIHLPSGQFTI